MHEARHTFASLAIVAGLNPKALSVDMGHASVTITLDRYGHLFPGNEDQSAGLLDAYLEAAVRQSRDSRTPDRADSGGLGRTSGHAAGPFKSGPDAGSFGADAGLDAMPPAGIEPATPGLGNLCSIH